MFSLKLSNIKVLSFLILILCLVSIGNDITFINKIFWVSLIGISYFLLQFKFRFKNLLIGGYGLLGIYIQLKYHQKNFYLSTFKNN